MADAGAALAPLRGARVEIDLGALERNFDRLAARVAPAGAWAVVKADAYGHGAVAVARTLEARGAGGFAVALVEEGQELRRAGIRSPILVLSPVPPSAYPLLRRDELVPALSSLDQVATLEAFARRAGWSLPVHLKFDTGMTRLGIPWRAAGEAVRAVGESAWLRLAGVMSHLAEAEVPESAANREQLERFSTVVAALSSEQRARVAVHLANSAAALHQAPTRLDLVRLGLSLYGVDPASPVAPGELEPVLSVVAEIVQCHSVARGDRVGYGGRWVAQRSSRIAMVPVGYADGYSWRLGNRAEAIVRGRRVPVAGSVSMDLLALDVTDSGGEVGEPAVLVGRRGEAEVTVGELAGAAGTIAYELLCLFGLRLPRRHLRTSASAGVSRPAAAGAGATR